MKKKEIKIFIEFVSLINQFEEKTALYHLDPVCGAFEKEFGMNATQLTLA